MDVPIVVSAISMVIAIAAIVMTNSIAPRNETEVATAYVCGLLDGRNSEPNPVKECGIFRQLVESRGVVR